MSAGCSKSVGPTPTAVMPPATTATPNVTATPSPTAVPSPTPRPTVVVHPTSTPTAQPRPTLVAATPVPVEPTATPLARSGGTLNLSSRATIAHQDVHDEASPALATWGPGIAYSRLMRLQSGPDVTLPSLAVECELCARWEMDGDGAFVFQLRPGVKWQDAAPVNGRSLTTDDIVYSYERQSHPDRPNAALLGAIATLEASDEFTLRITLSVPDADFLLSLAHGHSKIVAPEAVAVNGDLKDGPTIGSGPWTLTETSPNSLHTFNLNPSYFEDRLPLVDRLLIHVITDPVVRGAAFRAGSVDLEQMDGKEWAEYMLRRPSAPSVRIAEPTTGLEIGLNGGKPPFDDVRVRRAVLQAIDPWGAIEDIWLGSAFPAPGFQVAAPDWILTDSELRGYFSDPERARGLLSQAEVSLPVPVVMKVGDFGEAYHSHAERMAEEMRLVGFDVDMEVVNRRVFGDEVWSGGAYEMFVGPSAPSATPNGYLLPVLHSRGRLNTTGVVDPELDGLIEQQARELDPTARRDLILAIQRRVLDGAYRFMPAARIAIWTWSDRVQGFHPNFANFEYSHWSRVWLR